MGAQTQWFKCMYVRYNVNGCLATHNRIKQLISRQLVSAPTEMLSATSDIWLIRARNRQTSIFSFFYINGIWLPIGFVLSSEEKHSFIAVCLLHAFLAFNFALSLCFSFWFSCRAVSLFLHVGWIAEPVFCLEVWLVSFCCRLLRDANYSKYLFNLF